MVEDLARVSAKNGATPGMDTFVKQIEKMVNEDMKPKVTQQHDEAVLLVHELMEPFNLCGVQKQQNDLGVNAAITARAQRSEAHKTCRVNEGAAFVSKKSCDDALEILTSAKDSQCNNPTLSEIPDGSLCEPAPGETLELWVAARAIMFEKKDVAIKKIKSECVKNTALVDSKKVECDARDAEYTSAKSACDVEQTSLESAACSQAEKTTGSCETYTICYQNALTALNNAKPAIEAQVRGRKGEWRGLMRIQCLFGVFADGQGNGVDVAQIDSCKAKTHDTSHLNIAFPAAPAQTACAVTGSEPCTAAYTTEEYGALPINAQNQACGPCAWNAPTMPTTITTANGWHAILHYGTEAYTPTPLAVGDVLSTVGFGKLSDAAINAISDGSGYHHYKLTSGTDSSEIYVRTQKVFSDTSRAFGWSGAYQVCNTVDFGSCSWHAVSMARFDTEGEFGNNCARWFADYSANIHCYATGSSQKRCFADGAPCGHAMRTNVVMYKFGR